MYKRLLKIASNIIQDEIKSFVMTESQWKRYSERHPKAKRENHTIIPDVDIKQRLLESGKIQMTETQKKMDDLAKGPAHIRNEVAKSEETHWATLHDLSSDNSSIIRSQVAKNKKTRAFTLHKLAEDPYSTVRAAVAENKRTGMRTLRKLSKDASREVRDAVKRNKKTTDEMRQVIDKINGESEILTLKRK